MKSTVVPDEIIVVDDCGHPGLRDLLKNLERNTRVIYARINQDIPWNYTGARNLGVWLSRGDYLSMEDTDNIPSYKCYEDALGYFEDRPETNIVLYGRRPRISTELALTGDQESWMEHHEKSKGSRPRHSDTKMIRREAYLKVKGNDERFAGKYAWSCADFQRRTQRAGVIESDVSERGTRPINHVVSTHFFAVTDAETKRCKCTEEEREMDGPDSVCLKCGKPVWRKSYTNYNMASERDGWGKKNRGHYQSPIGILNFTYDFEIL
jgi:glycosyltransferase involved in cell wall biosynthesis